MIGASPPKEAIVKRSFAENLRIICRPQEKERRAKWTLVN
jgi:hypothetical protein